MFQKYSNQEFLVCFVGGRDGGHYGRDADSLQRIPAPLPLLLRLLEAIQRPGTQKGELAEKFGHSPQVIDSALNECISCCLGITVTDF